VDRQRRTERRSVDRAGDRRRRQRLRGQTAYSRVRDVQHVEVAETILGDRQSFAVRPEQELVRWAAIAKCGRIAARRAVSSSNATDVAGSNVVEENLLLIADQDVSSGVDRQCLDCTTLQSRACAQDDTETTRVEIDRR